MKSSSKRKRRKKKGNKHSDDCLLTTQATGVSQGKHDTSLNSKHQHSLTTTHQTRHATTKTPSTRTNTSPSAPQAFDDTYNTSKDDNDNNERTFTANHNADLPSYPSQPPRTATSKTRHVCPSPVSEGPNHTRQITTEKLQPSTKLSSATATSASGWVPSKSGRALVYSATGRIQSRPDINHSQEDPSKTEETANDEQLLRHSNSLPCLQTTHANLPSVLRRTQSAPHLELLVPLPKLRRRHSYSPSDLSTTENTYQSKSSLRRTKSLNNLQFPPLGYSVVTPPPHVAKYLFLSDHHYQPPPKQKFKCSSSLRRRLAKLRHLYDDTYLWLLSLAHFIDPRIYTPSQEDLSRYRWSYEDADALDHLPFTFTVRTNMTITALSLYTDHIVQTRIPDPPAAALLLPVPPSISNWAHNNARCCPPSPASSLPKEEPDDYIDGLFGRDPFDLETQQDLYSFDDYFDAYEPGFDGFDYG